MAFPLMALGAGLGQFAEQMQQQRAQQERSLMLQMQLANYQREMDKDRREASAADILARFDPSAALTGPGGAGGFGALRPQAGPQGGLSALTGPIPGMGGAPGGMPPPTKPDMGVGDSGAGIALSPYAQGNAAPGGASSVEGLWPEFSQRIQTMTQAMPPEIRNKFGIISGYRSPERQAQVNPGVTNSHHTGGGQGAGLAVDTTRDPDVLAWINANGRQFGVGYTLQGMPGEDNHLEMLGPDSRRIPANQMAQLGAGQTTPQQAAGIASGLASSIDMQGPPQPPIPPPSRATIAQMVRADERFKNADYRAVGVAVTNMEKSLQEIYRNKQAEYQNQLKLYHDYGPGRQQRRKEDLQDEALKAQLPKRPNPEIFQNSATGEMIQWNPGEPLPQGPGWHKAGTTPSMGNKASRNVEVTDAEGKKTFSGLAHTDATGQWIDDKTNKPIPLSDTDNFRSTPVSEGRQGAQQMTRVTNAGNLLSAELKNMMQLPSTSTASIFQGVESVPGRSLGDAIKRSLAAKLTPEEATDMATTFQGVGRAVASLETGGAATGLVGLADQAKVYMPQPTDTVGNVMRKMATVRQILERSLESAAAAKDTTEDQKKLFLKIKAEVAESMPYTVEDVTKLTRGDTKTYQELFRKTAKDKEAAVPAGPPKAAPGMAAPVGPPPEAVIDLKRDASPARRQQFDEIFGQGAAARVLAAPVAEAPIPPPQ